MQRVHTFMRTWEPWTVTALTLAFGSSVCIGILAGLFPAVKAARLDPIVALRYE